jgi:hypothetical protein
MHVVSAPADLGCGTKKGDVILHRVESGKQAHQPALTSQTQFVSNRSSGIGVRAKAVDVEPICD